MCISAELMDEAVQWLGALPRRLGCCGLFHQLDANLVMSTSESVQICSRTVVSVIVYQVNSSFTDLSGAVMYRER